MTIKISLYFDCKKQKLGKNKESPRRESNPVFYIPGKRLDNYLSYNYISFYNLPFCLSLISSENRGLE